MAGTQSTAPPIAVAVACSSVWPQRLAQHQERDSKGALAAGADESSALGRSIASTKTYPTSTEANIETKQSEYCVADVALGSMRRHLVALLIDPETMT